MNKQVTELSGLSKLASKMGNNIELIQGAGGNFSIKLGNIMWIKASGTWLAEAEERNIFVPLDINKLQKTLKDNTIETQASNCVVKEKDITGGLRPSIETSLHLLMPHKIVLHVHSINTIAVAVLNDAKEKFTKLLEGFNWAFVPYTRPGLPLTKEIEKVITNKPDILILENHGLVVGGSSISEAENLLNKIEKKLEKQERKTFSNKSDNLNIILNNIDNYQKPKFDLIHSIAIEEQNFNAATKGTLYPDHMVFLGSGISELTEAEKHNPTKPCYAIKGEGMIIRNDISEGAELMLLCLAKTLNKIDELEKVRYLTIEEEDMLINWDAEKYRQSING